MLNSKSHKTMKDTTFLSLTKRREAILALANQEILYHQRK